MCPPDSGQPTGHPSQYCHCVTVGQIGLEEEEVYCLSGTNSVIFADKEYSKMKIKNYNILMISFLIGTSIIEGKYYLFPFLS